MSDSDQPSSVPSMGAEGGFEEFEGAAPLRVTGFVSGLLGILSIFSIAGRPALILPVLAIILGIIALRPYGERKPVGRAAAFLGILLAVGFGSLGFCIPWFKSSTLGAQASYFSAQYIKLIQQDEAEYAFELGKSHVNRLPENLPLKMHYAGIAADKAADPQDGGEPDAVTQFRDGGIYSVILEAGLEANWVLDGSPRIYHRYGLDKADVTWRNLSDPMQKPVVIVMVYTIDNKSGQAEWRVDSSHVKSARIVAEKAS